MNPKQICYSNLRRKGVRWRRILRWAVQRRRWYRRAWRYHTRSEGVVFLLEQHGIAERKTKPLQRLHRRHCDDCICDILPPAGCVSLPLEKTKIATRYPL
jgi:hypothetical protein